MRHCIRLHLCKLVLPVAMAATVHEYYIFQPVLYLNLLQTRGGLTEILRHIKALGRVDLGIDQPLLEVSEG